MGAGIPISSVAKARSEFPQPWPNSSYMFGAKRGNVKANSPLVIIPALDAEAAYIVTASARYNGQINIVAHRPQERMKIPASGAIQCR